MTMITPSTSEPVLFDPDHQIADLASRAVRQSTYLHQRELHFESEQGRLTIKGVVTSYHQKQMAQEIVRRVDGVESIENQLVVDDIV